MNAHLNDQLFNLFDFFGIGPGLTLSSTVTVAIVLDLRLFD